MTINAFIRDTSYFQNIRDKGMSLNAEDFDIAFNNIAGYINNKLNPAITALSSVNVLGNPDLPNTFLQNKRGGTTGWAKITKDIFTDYSLEFNKFAKVAAGSIIATAAENIFSAVTPAVTNQPLVSRNNNSPIWKILSNDNFADYGIQEQSIAYGTITSGHLADGIVGRPLAAGSIENRHIVDNSLTGAKFKQGSITGAKLDPQIVTDRDTALQSYPLAQDTFKNKIQGRHIKDGTISNVYVNFSDEHFEDNSLSIRWGSGEWGRWNGGYTYIVDGAILPQHFKANCCNPLYFFSGSDSYYGQLRNIAKEKLDWRIRQALGI